MQPLAGRDAFALSRTNTPTAPLQCRTATTVAKADVRRAVRSNVLVFSVLREKNRLVNVPKVRAYNSQRTYQLGDGIHLNPGC
jgi:hypothetical protein